MQYKILFSLLIFPAIILGMENAEKMAQVRTMKEAQRFTGKMIACKPRTKLGESLVTSNGEQVNFSFINPTIDTFWHRETLVEEQYCYFHVLNRRGNQIVTRVVSEKTLAQEPLSLRLADESEKAHILACLEGKCGAIYTMEYAGNPEYKESCFTCKKLFLTDVAIIEALKEKRIALGITREDAAEFPS